MKDEYVRKVVGRFETEPGRVRFRASWRQKAQTLPVRGGVGLLPLHVGGVPRELLVDNMRQVVDQPGKGSVPAIPAWPDFPTDAPWRVTTSQ